MARRIFGGRLLVVAVLASLLAGCASTPPVQEMSDARQAVQAARREVGDHGSQPTLARAQTLLDRAERELADGDYDGARQSARAAKRLAEEARVHGR